MDIVPTKEQVDIIQASKECSPLIINAGAGTGKTSTLAMVAKELLVSSLLLVFNRAAKEDAESRFPPHVRVRTTHSLAYGEVGHKYKHKLLRPRGEYVNVAYTGGEIARYFSISPIPLPNDKWLSSAYQGVLVRNTVEKFEQSAATSVQTEHLPFSTSKHNIEHLILSYAKQLWRMRKDIKSKTLISHDTYMKLYQLSKPYLEYEVIYLDEAQDTSACTLDIVMRQADNTKIIVVGDHRQAIYGWRGSVNAMKIVEGTHSTLSESFRFGPESATLANLILDQAEGTLRSAEGLCTKIGYERVVDREKPYTVLYRTNTALLIDALKEIKKGKRVHLEINTTDLCRQLTDAQHLYRGEIKKVKHESLMMYTSWREMREESKSNPELSRIARLVENGEVQNIINILNKHRNGVAPDITMTTAHKSKGREWDQVLIGDDFPSHYDRAGGWIGLSEEEQNLLYVALTRAKMFLEYNSTIAEALQIEEAV